MPPLNLIVFTTLMIVWAIVAAAAIRRAAVALRAPRPESGSTRTEFSCEVVRISNVLTHPNADKLELAHFDMATGPASYEVVVQKGAYKVGDLAVYISVDCLVPTDRPQFAFLKKGDATHHRLRAARLRGVFSQGLLVEAPSRARLGDSVAEAYGVTYHGAGEEHPDVKVKSSTAPQCLPIYGVDSLKKVPRLFVEGEMVAITEKIHGCVPYNTPITMVDGTKKHINKLVIGDEILGMDDEGKVVATTVVHTFNNGPAQQWLRISGSRRGAGRGNSFFALNCTPEHRIWDPVQETYVHAADLRVGQHVSIMRNDPDLSPIQKSVLLGKLLGDGYLHKSGSTASVNWTHADKDRDYVEWCARAVGALAGESRLPMTSGYGSAMTRMRTISSGLVLDAFDSMYTENGKQVPAWVADQIDPLALAFWYMDDGSLGHQDDQEDRAHFAVCGFTAADCAVLLRGLSKLGIDGIYYKADGYSRIRLNSDAAERLFLLVAPYIPPCMQRKLPERYRGGTGWLPAPDPEHSYKPSLVTQVIESIEVDTKVQSERYDIETGTHNYFANGMVVHNCNFRFGWVRKRVMGVRVGWKFVVGSHRTMKEVDTEHTNDLWLEVARCKGLASRTRNYKGLAFYGEIFGMTEGGKKIQDLTYGLTTPAFMVFDVRRQDGSWLSYNERRDLLNDLGMQGVPVLDVNNWTPDLLTLAEGKSKIAPEQIREGIVVEALEGPRRKAKFVGQGYLLRKLQEAA